MKLSLPAAHLIRLLWSFSLLGCLGVNLSVAQNKTDSAPPTASACHVEPADYKGWHAQQISNRWVQLMVVPQNGGRLIQFTFAGHPYLFVNQKYAGKYLPPAQGEWFNYGGDKIWLLPEGNDDEQHWVGGSDAIDDSPFSFRKLSEGQSCEIEVSGSPDPKTGVQITRSIRLDADSPRVHFRATMKNSSGHQLEWSMQSVSQYDTSDTNPANASRINQNFRTYAPVNPASSYLNRYHVRFGPAENPAASVRDDGLFSLHYVHMAAELWLDSTAGWLAVVDGNSRFGMVERFQFEESRPYPGKASIIFWTNGPELKLDANGNASLSSGGDGSPTYLEAEINSPLCKLRPGESCNLETEWSPIRVGDEFHGATDPGVIVRPLNAVGLENGKVRLSGSFGVFFAGRLVAHFYGDHGSDLGSAPVADVDPSELVSLQTEIAPSGKAARVSLHLEDATGLDRGAFQEIRIDSKEAR